MTCVELFSDMLNDCAQLLSAVDPSPSLGSTQDDPSHEGSDWLPFWGGLLVGVLGIAGTLISQSISGKRELRVLKEQNSRMDAHDRREELKLAYAELIKLLGLYFHAIYETITVTAVPLEEIFKRWEAGPTRTAKLKEREEANRLIVAHKTQIVSQLSIVDLLGEPEVYYFGHHHFVALGEIDGRDSALIEASNKWEDLMKEAMRASLSGDRTSIRDAYLHYRREEHLEDQRANDS